MKRQAIRKTLILLSFLFFPVTIYYLSPYLIYMGGFESVVSGSALMFGGMFLSSLFVGRLFCGWVCPAGGVQEACFIINDQKVKTAKWLKWVIWIPWLLGIIAVYAAHGIKSFDFFYQTKYGISIHRPEAYIIFYGVVLLIFFMSVFIGRRSFCHHLCWMAPFMIIGRKLRNILKWPSLQLKSKKDNCTNCMTCKYNCPMSIDVNSLVQKEQMEHRDCILCGTCIDNCPSKVIDYSL